VIWRKIIESGLDHTEVAGHNAFYRISDIRSRLGDIHVSPANKLFDPSNNFIILWEYYNNLTYIHKVYIIFDQVKFIIKNIKTITI